MSSSTGFRIKEGYVFRSRQTGVDWRVVVAGAKWCQVVSETPEAISTRFPTAALRSDFVIVKLGD